MDQSRCSSMVDKDKWDKDLPDVPPEIKKYLDTAVATMNQNMDFNARVQVSMSLTPEELYEVSALLRKLRAKDANPVNT